MQNRIGSNEIVVDCFVFFFHVTKHSRSKKDILIYEYELTL